MTTKKTGIAEKEARLRLREVRGVGSKRYTDLMGYFGSGKKVLSAPLDALEQVVHRRIAQGILSAALNSGSIVRWYAQQGIGVLIEGVDAHNPRLLAQALGPPVLYVKGKNELLSAQTVAVVGSRQPTGYGIEAARGIAGGLAHSGVVIVSGLAEGIDSVARRAALSGGGGRWRC